MKEKIIGPFLKSSKEIIMQVGNITIEEQHPYINKDVVLDSNIGVIIGLTGSIKGQVMINIPEDIGRKIASNMMGGIPVAAFDDIAKSAICELGNIIVGNAATGLYDMGLKVDITSPSIIEGKGMTYSVGNQDILTLPFNTEDNQIQLHVSIKE